MDIFAEEHVMSATSHANAQLILSCPVYPLAYQPMNCFKRFENIHFGHFTVALISENTGSATITGLR